MTVAVNSVQKDNNDIQLLGMALGVAKDIYGVTMSNKAEQLKMEADTRKQQELRDKQAADDIEKFNTTYIAVPEGTKGAVAIKNPGTGTEGIYMPRVDYRAGETNRIASEANAFNKSIAESQRLSKYEADFQNDKFVRENTEKVSAANFIDQLIAQESPILDAVAQRQVFRLSGDVGAIREPDLRDLGSSPELKERALAALNMMTQGQRLSDESRADIKKMVQIVRSVASRDVNRIADRYADTAARELRSYNKTDVLKFLKPENALPGYDPADNSMFSDVNKALGGGTALAGPKDTANYKYQPGTILNINGKRYKVEMDGDTLTEIR